MARKTRSVPARIALAFSVIILGATLAISLLELVALNSARHLKDSVERYTPVVAVASDLERDILNARINYIYFLTIQRPGALEQGNERFARAKGDLAKLQQLLRADNQTGELSDVAARLAASADKYENEKAASIRLIDSGVHSGPDYDQRVKEWAGAGALLAQDSNKLQGLAGAKVGQAQNEATQTLHLVTLMGLLIMGFGSVTGAVAAYLAVRSIAKDLKEAALELNEEAQQVTTVASQMCESSQSLAEASTRQSDLIHDTTAATEKVSQISHKNSDRARHAHDGTNSVSSDISITLDRLHAMADSMGAIVEASKQISQVASAIDGIAFQTNILALNAAVEAARAGQNGMGFAVVADEVRRLAQRSSEAARETQCLVEGSIKQSHEGSERLRQLSESISVIAGRVNDVQALVEEVSESSQEQARAVGAVTGAVLEIRQLTLQSAAQSQQSAAAGGELESQARAMRTVVENLSAMLGSKENLVTRIGG